MMQKLPAHREKKGREKWNICLQAVLLLTSCPVMALTSVFKKIYIYSLVFSLFPAQRSHFTSAVGVLSVQKCPVEKRKTRSKFKNPHLKKIILEKGDAVQTDAFLTKEK